jgi:hypothetical protein
MTANESDGRHGMGLWMAPLMFSVTYTRRCRIKGRVMTMIACITTTILHQPSFPRGWTEACAHGHMRDRPSHLSRKLNISTVDLDTDTRHEQSSISFVPHTVPLPLHFNRADRLISFPYVNAFHSPSKLRMSAISYSLPRQSHPPTILQHSPA